MLHGKIRGPFVRTRGVAAGDFTQGILPPGATLTRASLGWYFDSSITLTQAAINEPRFTYSRTGGGLEGLLVEPAATTQQVNPRFEGGTPGAALSLPDFMSYGGNPASGAVPLFTARGTENGIPYMDHRMLGTTTIADQTFVFFQDQACVPGQNAFISFYLSNAAGTTANLACDCGIAELNAGTSFVGFQFSNLNNLLPSLTSSLVQYRPISAAIPCVTALTVKCRPFLRYTYASGTAVNHTMRIGAQMMEVDTAMSSTLLPPVGVPGTINRSADVLTIAKANGTYNISIVRLSGTTNLPGTVVSGGSYTVPTNVSPLRQVIFA